VGDNVGPEHLINWTRIAYNEDPEEAFGEFTALEPWSHLDQDAPPPPLDEPASAPESAQILDMRDEIRRIVLEELRQMLND
jgi:hypothetical protein